MHDLSALVPTRRPVPREEPIFLGMVEEWGCPLVGVPWTGRRPSWSEVTVTAAEPDTTLIPLRALAAGTRTAAAS